MHLMLSLQCNSFHSSVIRMTLPGIIQLLQFPTSGDILNEATLHLTCFFSFFVCSKISSCSSLNLSYRKDHSSTLMIKILYGPPCFLVLPPNKIWQKLLCSQYWFRIASRLSLHRFNAWPVHFVVLLCVCKQWSFLVYFWAVRYMFTLRSLLFFWFQEFLNAL